MKRSLSHLLLTIVAPLGLLSSGAVGCAFQNPDTPAAPIAVAQATPLDEWTRRRALFDYDTKAPLEAKEVSNTENRVAVTRKFTIKGAKGATVPLYIVMPKTASATSKVPGMVLVHGLGGSIEEMQLSAQVLAVNGYASVIPEIVAHGERRKNQSNIMAGDAKVLHDGIVESVGDIRRSLDLLLQQPEVDGSRIGYTGLSLGAIIGSMVVATDERIKAAGFVVGGADWKLILKQSQEGNAQRERDERNGATTSATEDALVADVDPKNYVGKIAPRPVLMLNGKRDDIIPPASAKAFFEAAGEPKQQIWFDADHFLPPLQVAETLQTWFEKNLKSKNATAATS